MSDSTYPLYPAVAFLAFVLVLIPLPWHLQAWNSGTCLYMIWTAAGCLFSAVNAVVWRDNAIDKAPILCDITTRLQVGIAVAIPAASLCINRRLYIIASCESVSISRKDKRNAVLIDLCIGLGIPFLQMILQFIVQGHRYDIAEEFGCNTTTFNTPPAYPLVFCWPIVIGLVSAIYCILTLRTFMKRRAQFSQFLSSNHSLSIGRYFRLMALASTELMFNLPIATYGLYLNISGNPIRPWVSWSDTHSDWYTPGLLPALIWKTNPHNVVTLNLSRWVLVFCAVLFFAYFGFAEEARKNYKCLWTSIPVRLGIRTSAFALKVSGSVGDYNVRGNSDIVPVSGALQSFVSFEKRFSRAPQHALPTTASMETSFDKTDYSSFVATSSPTQAHFKVPTVPPPLPSSSSCYTMPFATSDCFFSRPESQPLPVSARRARPLLPFELSSPPRAYDVERQNRPRSSSF